MYTKTIIFGGLNRLIMRKLMCDCCGEEIDTTYMDEYNIHPKAKLIVFDEIHGELDKKFGNLEYDLCENCTEKLVSFIKKCNNVTLSKSR